MAKWTGVDSISLTLESDEDTCGIYANGWNRIGVTITVDPTDEHADAMDIDPKHLAGRVWLVDYLTESNLNWKGSSGWCYSNAANEFTAIPDGYSARPEATTEADGARPVSVTFYVYCSPGVNRKSIGAKVKTDSGDIYTSSRSGYSHSKVTLNPRAALTYMRRDVDWDWSRATTKEGSNTKRVTTNAWNYYLSLKATDNYFVTFRAHGHYGDAGYEGLFAYNMPDESRHKKFYGGYVWYSEPHKSGTGEIVNFPRGNDWWDYVNIYDRAYPERYLCFTWVCATTTDFEWDLPNGPITGLKAAYVTRIVAWDRYGNSGTFWVDGNDITYELKIYDHNP
ncbi:hypothetical protein [Streptomyces sp. MNP-20]|uniref:hypothetical protein n=1 Tax=Streptomyces sp. MNP-20 TaxID=2721165 RepID=UPI001553DE05|nr:hypothetical protein [Streptomyces sp. MNP-20]